jgi:hypothetical protein
MPKMPFRRRKPLSERIAEKLSTARAQATEQIESTASSIADQAVAGVKAAAHRLPSSPIDREKVSQDAHDVAHLAATTAVDLWDRARSKSTSVKESIPSRDYLSEQLGVAAASIDKRARDAEKAVHAKATHARERVKAVEPAIEERLVAAKDHGVEIVDESVKTGRSVFATILWLGAAFAAIYYLLFDRERRDKIWSVTKEVAAETKDIINDLRGYDQEFA